MRRTFVLFLSLVCLAVFATGALAGPHATGEVQTLRTYDPDAGELPEGIAIDKRGRIYLTMAPLGELRRIDTDGSEHVVAQLPVGGGNGALGLAVDAPGNVYVAVHTNDPATQGVYRVTPAGDVSRLPGSEQIGFANGVAFGDEGTLYVTDTIRGAVWAIPKGGSAELWVEGPLFTGTGDAPPPFPIGANGITYRLGTVFVTNTEQASIVSIPVNDDGSAGEPSILIQDPALGGSDGIAADVHGDLYVPVIGQSTLVRVAGDGSGVEVLADKDDGLDYASSAAFGTGRGERTTLFFVNFSIGPFFGDVRTHGPALLSIDVGVPGLPQP